VGGGLNAKGVNNQKNGKSPTCDNGSKTEEARVAGDRIHLFNGKIGGS